MPSGSLKIGFISTHSAGPPACATRFAFGESIFGARDADWGRSRFAPRHEVTPRLNYLLTHLLAHRDLFSDWRAASAIM